MAQYIGQAPINGFHAKQSLTGDGSTTADGNVDTSAQNELFDDADNSVLDFTETNPFGDVGSPS